MRPDSVPIQTGSGKLRIEGTPIRAIHDRGEYLNSQVTGTRLLSVTKGTSSLQPLERGSVPAIGRPVKLDRHGCAPIKAEGERNVHPVSLPKTPSPLAPLHLRRFQSQHRPHAKSI